MLKKALLWHPETGVKVKCLLCRHGCLLDEGEFGVCGMRQCRGGELFTYASGPIISGRMDPVEKKPLYHFLPGTLTYSAAGAGCNFSCKFCQNWEISTVSAASGSKYHTLDEDPGSAVKNALALEAKSISFTYTEPTLLFEYAFEVFAASREYGLGNIFVTNGYMTSEAIEKIAEYLDAVNVDLKFYKDDTYKNLCGASLGPVLDTIRRLKEKGIWIEITTLVIPGINDSETELGEIAEFIAGVDINIPWHVSAFHPAFNFCQEDPTPCGTIVRAVDAGRAAGLNYVYPGNTGEVPDTFCPECGKPALERSKLYLDLSGKGEKIGFSGECPACGFLLPGRWHVPDTGLKNETGG